MVKKALKIGIIVAVAVVVLYLIAILCISNLILSRSYLDDFVIRSPDQNHTLIIKEWDAVGIGGGGAEIYKKRILGKTKLGELSTDETVHPFRDGYYRVEWKEDSVVIRYYSGRPQQQIDDPDTWDTVCFDLT